LFWHAGKPAAGEGNGGVGLGVWEIDSKGVELFRLIPGVAVNVGICDVVEGDADGEGVWCGSFDGEGHFGKPAEGDVESAEVHTLIVGFGGGDEGIAAFDVGLGTFHCFSGDGIAVLSFDTGGEVWANSCAVAEIAAPVFAGIACVVRVDFFAAIGIEKSYSEVTGSGEQGWVGAGSSSSGAFGFVHILDLGLVADVGEFHFGEVDGEQVWSVGVEPDELTVLV